MYEWNLCTQKIFCAHVYHLMIIYINELRAIGTTSVTLFYPNP
jgi:hypothetical protein